jgi:hypothetical protein
MKLICLGDSWTAGHGVEDDRKYNDVAFPEKFIEKLREQNSWPRWVAEKLNMEFVNCGVCGYGNEYIFKDLKNVIDNNFIQKDDTIIIMFSYPYRYIKDKNDVVKLFWQFEKVLKNHKHYYFNSFFPTFKEENFNTSNLPKSFINPNGCVSDILRDYEMENDISVWEYGSRSVWNDEKNFYEGDYHPNLLGYKLIADYIYNSIKNNI